MVLEVIINYSLKIMTGIALKLNNHLRSFKKKMFSFNVINVLRSFV